MAPDERKIERLETPDDSSDTARILPLVRDPGNRRVLIDWIESNEGYELASHSSNVLMTEYDCLIVDKQSLVERADALISRKENEDALLPFVLILEETEEKRVREDLRHNHPDLFEVINAFVSMPVAEYRLTDRIQTLLRMRAQSREVTTQRKQLRAIRDEHAGHGVIITDREAKIEYVNQAFEQQSGYDKAEVIGENPRMLQSGEHSEAFYEDMWETILAGDVWQGEIINERKDGDRYVVNMTIAPVTNLDGEIDRFIGVNHDITELKELEDSLRSQGEQLELLNRVLRHDIRNDMNVILGWTDLLGEHVDENGEEYIGRILHSGRHIVELTKVAGDLVADITTEGDPELEPVDLVHTLEEEVAKRKEAFSEATMELAHEIPPNTMVWGNTLLPSVFRNLINNAVQHNDTGEPSLTISGRREKGSVIVEIADNGPGVPDTEKERIFAQAHKGLDSEGTGMGLYLVHSLVDTYGGEVSIEDNEPEGAIFVVKLPVVQSAGGTREGDQ